MRHFATVIVTNTAAVVIPVYDASHPCDLLRLRRRDRTGL